MHPRDMAGVVGEVVKIKHLCHHCGRRFASKKCNACREVYYCDKSCQRAHWKEHKGECNQVHKKPQCPKSTHEEGTDLRRLCKRLRSLSGGILASSGTLIRETAPSHPDSICFADIATSMLSDTPTLFWVTRVRARELFDNSQHIEDALAQVQEMAKAHPEGTMVVFALADSSVRMILHTTVACVGP